MIRVYLVDKLHDGYMDGHLPVCISVFHCLLASLKLKKLCLIDSVYMHRSMYLFALYLYQTVMFSACGLIFQ